MANRKITRALISVFYKDNLAPIVHVLGKAGVEFVSTGGTQEFIEKLGYPVTPVEKLTGYPSIFGGRVKTLHPAIFGGILYRREDAGDVKQAHEYKIPPIDLVIVDLYPFEETVAKGGSEEDIIEKIDIGGISLIRGAAKNFNDVIIVASRNQYLELQQLLEAKNCFTDLSDRKHFAAMAFDVTSHYDSAIFQYFNSDSKISSFTERIRISRESFSETWMNFLNSSTEKNFPTTTWWMLMLRLTSFRNLMKQLLLLSSIRMRVGWQTVLQ